MVSSAHNSYTFGPEFFGTWFVELLTDKFPSYTSIIRANLRPPCRRYRGGSSTKKIDNPKILDTWFFVFQYLQPFGSHATSNFSKYSYIYIITVILWPTFFYRCDIYYACVCLCSNKEYLSFYLFSTKMKLSDLLLKYGTRRGWVILNSLIWFYSKIGLNHFLKQFSCP